MEKINLKQLVREIITEININETETPTKELAQHAALTKGYTVDGYEPPTNVTKKPVLERLIRSPIDDLPI